MKLHEEEMQGTQGFIDDTPNRLRPYLVVQQLVNHQNKVRHGKM